jgi:hypothetical protein
VGGEPRPELDSIAGGREVTWDSTRCILAMTSQICNDTPRQRE